MVRDGGLFMVFGIYSDRSVAGAISLERDKYQTYEQERRKSEKSREKTRQHTKISISVIQ